MEAFTERLSTVADLSADELDALEAEMIAAFDTADEAGDVDGMQSLADGLDSVREEKARRTATAEGETVAEELAEEVVAASASEASEDTNDSEPVEDEAVTADAAVETAVADEATSETEDVAVVVEAEASEEVVEADVEETEVTEEAAVEDSALTETQEEISMDVEVTAEDVPEESVPAVEAVMASAAPYTITAGGDVPGITAGSELTDMDAVSEAMAAKVNSMRGISGDGEHIIVASIRGEDTPDERMLSASDSIGNDRKIRALVSDQDALTAEALTAAGWCAPKAPVYDVPTIGTTDRPVANAIPTFSAERGGIAWTAPPSLSALTALQAADSAALGLFKADGTTFIDAEGIVPTVPPSMKPCYTVPCGTPAEAELEALTLCLCFDNLSSRAFAGFDMELIA